MSQHFGLFQLQFKIILTVLSNNFLLQTVGLKTSYFVIYMMSQRFGLFQLQFIIHVFIIKTMEHYKKS